eukprot:GHVU01201745.1.p1 GENE.GHVU01201745.1~~GHVU01201745.1.p1  ORF type:complete len:116 (+),score=2.03 GHVU01201745.1:406-753(+)
MPYECISVIFESFCSLGGGCMLAVSQEEDTSLLPCTQRTHAYHCACTYMCMRESPPPGLPVHACMHVRTYVRRSWAAWVHGAPTYLCIQPRASGAYFCVYDYLGPLKVEGATHDD